MSTALDADKKNAFAEKMIGVLNHSVLALMTALGHRTGLFDAMDRFALHATAREIAAEAGLSERYVREWLGAMVTGGVVEYDPSGHTYYLPPEHAELLTREAPGNMAASAQWVAVLGSAEDELVKAFAHGRGVRYGAYNRFHEVMAEESARTVVAALHELILPVVPGLIGRLAAGIDVLDVGCGSGLALIALARAFPDSRFVGYDLSPEAVRAARAEAARWGVPNVRFEDRDLTNLNEHAAYDLVTAFDAIHDQAQPDRVLANVRAALRPDGAFLMQEIAGSGHLAGDLKHPLAPFLYGISCMHCMSVSLAYGGPGLGAMWGRERALAMLRDAGFGEVDVRELPHDLVNYYYVARPV
ncbi:MAG: class I SAM-dependent methyltransferase [Planctomycetes bacterium]|nr:class I SAM-dependent methyltransferase [Planctomycetota bacterium]